MTTQFPANYYTDQDLTKCALPFREEGYNLFVSNGEILEIGKVVQFEIEEPKKKLEGWGLFKGLKINEEEIEEAKKSLFPDKEYGK